MIAVQRSREIYFDSRRGRRVQTGALVYLAFVSLALVLQWHDGAFRGEFGAHPDEAAHYVTGLMFHDYVTGMHFLSPVRFAENYYFHYPKVAIGHFPPAFYLIQGIWTLFFSASRASMMLLMAVLATLIALMLYLILAPDFGGLIAFAAGLVFLVIPAVQAQTAMVMADIPVALFSLLAATSFGGFLETERREDVLAFGIFAALAIMTKGSALALGMLPPVAIVITRKWRFLHCPALWASAAIVFLICGPWYFWTMRFQQEGWDQHSSRLSYALVALPFYGSHFIRMLGWALALLAAIGLVAKLRSLWTSEQPNGVWAALIGWLLGFPVLLLAIPTGLEDRFLLPAIPAAIAFAVAGLCLLARKLPSTPLKPAFLSLLLVGLFAATSFGLPNKQSYGFAPVARLLVSQPQFRNSIILVSSDADGEGMLISEVAMRERRPGHVVLRASKILADTQWNGNGYRSIYSTPREVLHYIDSVPVQVVVLDSSISGMERRRHEELLRQAISSSAGDWKLFGTYPVWRKGLEHPDALQVYVLVHNSELARGRIRINMEHTFGRSLDFQVPRN